MRAISFSVRPSSPPDHGLRFELYQADIPKMFSGEWQGTMALTEPQAGSSLADITTTAEPTDQGYYRIKGQKIFISAADHDGADNVVNLMLAKIKGAPAGVKGISLFIVPETRIEEQGSLVPNDISITATYHKLGYRGCSPQSAQPRENDDCRGYLVGEPHKGLPYMFQMMNESRIGVGAGARRPSHRPPITPPWSTRRRGPRGEKSTNKGTHLAPDPDHRACRHQADAPLPARRRRGVAFAPLPVQQICRSGQSPERRGKGDECSSCWISSHPWPRPIPRRWASMPSAGPPVPGGIRLLR